MRIDYSEPKQSYVGGAQSRPRPRKEPAGMMVPVVIITGLITFILGFGTGWFFSQRSAKKAFQAAATQTSLETAKPAAAPQPPPHPQQPAPAPAPQPAQQAGQQQPQPGQAGAPATAGQPHPDPPLSFYKTLPSGQKSTVLGSGINSSEGKQPLQAAIPANVRQQSQNDAAKPAGDRPAPAEKAPGKTESGYTVQLASFSLKSEAETLRVKLAGKGYNAFISESNQGDKGIWYRVRIGRKLEQEAAKELAAKLGRGAVVMPEKD